jgi:hypothetical protein
VIDFFWDRFLGSYRGVEVTGAHHPIAGVSATLRRRFNRNITDDMRTGSDYRPRRGFSANRPYQRQPRIPHNNQTLDSHGPDIKIRGTAYQIYERYIALVREAATSNDRVAAENFYQHAEHYFRINNINRESKQPTPVDVETNLSEPAGSSEVHVDRS